MIAKVWFEAIAGLNDMDNIDVETIISPLTFEDFIEDIKSDGGLLTSQVFIPYHKIVLIQKVPQENEPTESP